MSYQIVITTGARLHFGLLANGPQEGRRFGGVGLMIDDPGFRLGFRATETDNVVLASDVLPEDPIHAHNGDIAQRIREFMAAFRDATTSSTQPTGRPGCEITLLRRIPSHVGLGSGTQLGMAVAQGLSLLMHETLTSPVELGRRVGRGKRSALGIHGFERGGFLVEGGKSTRDVGSLITRLDFPQDWRIVLVRPQDARGLSGCAEKQAFAQLAPMERCVTDRLCGIVVMELLPAIVDQEFDMCAASLYEYGRIVGEYFSPAQQGIYADQRMVQLAAELRKRGVAGVGQTSWGPTLFALTRNVAAAEDLMADFRSSEWGDCEWRISAALNSGAALEFPACISASSQTNV